MSCELHPRYESINVANKGCVCRACYILHMMGRPDMSGHSSAQWCAYVALRKYVRPGPNGPHGRHPRHVLPALDPLSGYA